MKGLDGEYVYDPGMPWRAHTAFVKAGVSQYVRCWENHIRDKTQRREERIREKRQSEEHGDDDNKQSDNDGDDKGGRTDGKEVEEQQHEQRDGGKDIRDVADMRGGNSAGADGEEVVKPAVNRRFHRELAGLGSELAFSSDVQLNRRMQCRDSAVVNQLDTSSRRGVLRETLDLQTPQLYTIDVPAATLFTDKNGKPLRQPGDRQPVHARLDESGDEDAQSRNQDNDKRLLHIKQEAITRRDEGGNERGNHDAQTMQDAMDALGTTDEVEEMIPGAEKAKTSIQVNGCTIPHTLIGRTPAMKVVASNGKDERSARVGGHVIEGDYAHTVYTSHHALGTENYVAVATAHDSEGQGQ